MTFRELAIFVLLSVLVALLGPPAAKADGEFSDVPVKGMITMVDLGADKCIPCKMMAPIITKLEKEYEGRAAIVFIDVWKHNEQARRFGIRAIPTQIFYNKSGQEVLRHEGFFAEKEIRKQLNQMGVK